MTPIQWGGVKIIPLTSRLRSLTGVRVLNNIRFYDRSFALENFRNKKK